ncbi:conserved hypothetical protein [Ferroglobus placidus DSM 10642]|uniref:Uncharacterized protein n=1 Tax=Ferroglobus placidus (strain DSM 10642 / AEDII12DO) TaxID=589924 RepID=D3S312_FERPA|nr:hypothetical protein [Ferroglobus placidus]ADC64645.1 conserved hypothetical protein [Ferroglobus placidus DSM 10642]
MGDTAIVLVGLLIGLVLGLSGVATLLNLMSDVVSNAQTQLSQLGAASTIILLVMALILIIKVRVLSSLIVGAIVGAVAEFILEANGIHIFEAIRSAVFGLLGS